MKQFEYQLVKNPEYYKDGCIPSHSDHVHYRDLEELEEEKSGFHYSLNGLWRFHYARNYQETIIGFEKEEYSCKNWEYVRVPAHIQMEGYDVPQYVNVQYPWEGHEEVIPGELPEKFNPVASYVKYFVLPENMKKERVYLTLEGAESAVAVWLNGVFIGYHEDSFTPAEFELTQYLKKGENKLAVQVFKWCAGSWCEDQDFFRFSGLFRDVYLYSVPKVHVRDLHINAIPEINLKMADFTMEGEITGRGRINIALYEGKKLVFEKVQDVENNFLFKKKVQHPQLWSSEYPFLYDCIITVYDTQENIQEYILQKVGFRRFELRNAVMYLNGQRIVFKGVNRHDFNSITGRCVSKEVLEKDLCIMKQNNINAIRTSHYPNDSMLYQLCDIYGIYLIDETNMETHGTWDDTGSEHDKDYVLPKDKIQWSNLLLERALSMYERDKNHPSILIWSCGNESYGGSVIYEMARFFKEKDDTRLVHYEGIYNDRSYPDTSDMESQMYPSVESIKKFLETNREKPFICCEYSHAMGNSCGALYKYTKLTDQEELYQGGFIWDFVDQSIVKKNRYGEQFQAYGGDFGERPTDYNFSGNGLVDGNRNVSPKMQEVKYLYQNISLQVEKNQVEIENKHLFLNTNHWECKVLVERDGKKVEHVVLSTDIAPLSKKVYPLNLKEQRIPGNYVITVSYHLKQDEIWADKGHEIAFGQYVYQIKHEEKKEKLPVKVIRSKHNIGVSGEGFEVLFSLLNGGLVSYKYGGVQIIEQMPKPNFWRAPVDNDWGSLMPARYAQWKIASLYLSTKKVNDKSGYPEVLPYKIEKKKYSTVVQFTYWMPTTPESFCELSYEVYGDGKVTVQLTYNPVLELKDMPEFGVMFKVNPDYDQITWFGLGPEETYADRKKGGKTGLYTNYVKDNMASYLVPQECGNKEEVRYAKVTDSKGRGLLFTCDEEQKGMCFSALPYTPHQIEEAMHSYELPRVEYTVVRVAKAQMGVGGDDSWGARTHKEYLIPVEQPLCFKFSFQGI